MCIRRCDPMCTRCPTKSIGKGSGVFCRDRCRRYRRAAGASDGGSPAACRWMWRQHCTSHAARHDATLRLLAWARRAAIGFDFDGARHSRLRALRAGPPRFPMRASLASSGTHATADVPDGDACKARCCSLTTIVRSFAGSVRDCRSAWLLPATCQNYRSSARQS